MSLEHCPSATYALFAPVFLILWPMPKRSPARKKLIDAALALFSSQGVTETTTRQIADRAGVNEVTIFRQFGNKHGLMLAAIEEAEVFSNVGEALLLQSQEVSGLDQALRDYADGRLEALESMPDFVRSLVGESGQYAPEHRQAIGRELTQANRFVAQYLEAAIQRGQLKTALSAEKIASLLNSLLLGYAVLEFTSEFHLLWRDRQDFLNSLVGLFLHGAVQDGGVQNGGVQNGAVQASYSAPEQTVTVDIQPNAQPKIIEDLPAPLVHDLLRQGKERGPQDYALMYVLFGAGLAPEEIAALERQHHSCDRTQQLLRIPAHIPSNAAPRMVPINQWILGKRYGSYQKNPLTQWLKNRKDESPSLFINEADNPLTAAAIVERWQTCARKFGSNLTIGQAQQTWRVDMLVRGISMENLSLITGVTVAGLQPYGDRARVKQALNQAVQLDQKRAGEGGEPE